MPPRWSREDVGPPGPTRGPHCGGVRPWKLVTPTQTNETWCRVEYGRDGSRTPFSPLEPPSTIRDRVRVTRKRFVGTGLGDSRCRPSSGVRRRSR